MEDRQKFVLFIPVQTIGGEMVDLLMLSVSLELGMNFIQQRNLLALCRQSLDGHWEPS